MLTPDQLARYDRQLRLEGFGPRAQERLLGASVLVVGAGGLGSPALLYLAAAGVGRIGIVDDDVVDRSNLHRQVIHGEGSLGVAKVASAARAVRELNPDVVVEAHDARLDEANAERLVGGYDLVLDGADNFQTRYLINDAALMADVPVVHGSIYRFEGQLTVFPGRAGPCYRCLFPSPPAPGAVPSCADVGVLGVLPGVIGTLQATEAVKLLAGIGEPLVGRLLRYDALTMRWTELRYGRDARCPACGGGATRHEAHGAGLTRHGDGAGDVARIGVADYARLRARGEEHVLLDVRDAWEVAAGSIDGHVNVPLGELAARLAELGGRTDRLVVCQCQWGGRSLLAAELLRSAGFERVASLEGGYLAWRRLVDPGASN